MALTEYPVEGMTCGHCVAAVTAELHELPGIEDVTVDLVPDGLSTVTVTSEIAPELDQVRAAIEEAGYVMADAPI